MGACVATGAVVKASDRAAVEGQRRRWLCQASRRGTRKRRTRRARKLAPCQALTGRVGQAPQLSPAAAAAAARSAARAHVTLRLAMLEGPPALARIAQELDIETIPGRRRVDKARVVK